MIDRQIIINNIKNVLKNTNLDIKDKYIGKVRDMYFVSDKSILISTDRQSAFDRSLGFIPFKGEVLAQSSVWWFKKTAHIVKNHFIASPDANVVIAKKAKVLPIEFVVRGYITGSTSTSLWTHYDKGCRNYCGIKLENGLKKNQKLPQNILTPTTKELDHDRPISVEDIVKEGWLTQEQWDFTSQKALELFEFGQKIASEHGLILADTKYEFGIDEVTGEIILIDEIHTPDSSRFWLKDSYVECFDKGQEPENIDKEFFRLWFARHCDPYKDAVLPQAPQELVVELSQKYIKLYEMITGEKFTPITDANINQRIIKNVTEYIKADMTTNILLIGSGSREHALAKAINKSKTQHKLYCLSGAINPAIEKLTDDYIIADICDADAIVEYAKKQNITLAIIGPEAPLEKGVADRLKEIGLGVVGPTKDHAQLETSKAFTRDLIDCYGINANPFFKRFDSMDGVKETLKKYEKQFVIKADGLCGGKGVLVWGDHLHSMREAVSHCQSLVDVGKEFVIEEKLIGEEFSLISFTDGENFIHMPAVQDHKRAYEGDKGPNTGGMGTYSDANHRLPFLSDSDIERAKEINEKVAYALKDKFGTPYQGILYGGFMATIKDTKVIEYNARFGDPEAMNLLSLLEGDFIKIAKAISTGGLDKVKSSFKNQATVCKYLVPLGYPNSSVKNFYIDISQCPDDVELFLGAVDLRGSKLIGTGSRAIAVLGMGDTIAQAEQKAENGVRNIYGKLFHRPDIGTKDLINKRIKNMNMLRGHKYKELGQMSTLKLVVLGSTRGTNMQAIIDAINSKEIDASIEMVISNRKEAFILQRAKDNRIAHKLISSKNKTREQYDKLLISEINSHKPDLILLIGFMRILSEQFTDEFNGKILNVHGSLLPKHSGLMDLAMHQSVLDAGDEESGCTIHQVNELVDSGKIELQLKCAVEQNDTAESLKNRVQALESKAWVEVIKAWNK